MKTENRLLNFTFLVSIVFMASTTLANSKEQTIYHLKFDIFQAAVSVRLNDIPVLTHDSAGKTSSEKPVPENIIDGENVITVSMRPLEQEEDLFSHPNYVEIALIARDKDAPLGQGKQILHMRLSANKDDKVVLDGSNDQQGKAPARILKHNAKEIVAERKVDIQSPYPRWAWQDGVTIKANEENFSALLEEYKNIYEVLASENITRIKDLYSHAARELSRAYHYDDIDEGHRIINTGGLVGDDQWMLGNFHTLLENNFPLDIEVYADGKLAHIVNAKTRNEGGIVYLHKEVNMVSVQKFGFYKTKDDEWIMIR